MIATRRLILRDWRDRDRAAFHAILADPRVMAMLGRTRSRAESDEEIDAMIADNRAGMGQFAVERRADRALIGVCGIGLGAHETPIGGQPEIGWRLGFDHWGRGYANEAARASIGWAFAAPACTTVWAVTARTNVRSRRVMERLSMVRVPQSDFSHPAMARRDPLRAQVTYRIDRPRG